LANTKAAIKEIRVARVRQERNKAASSQVKSAARAAVELLAGEDKEAATKGFRAAECQLDRAASRASCTRTQPPAVRAAWPKRPTRPALPKRPKDQLKRILIMPG